MIGLALTDLPRQRSADDAYRIDIIRISDLSDFVEEFFRHPEGQVIAPISRQRANGLVRNPFSSPDDPALLVAYDGRKVVGHYAIVPGLLRKGDTSEKVLWGSALYVHPDYRAGGAVFLQLIRTVTSLGPDFIISGFTEAVHEIYQVLGFVEPEPLGTCMINISKLDLFGSALWLARDRGRISGPIWKTGNLVAPAMKRLIYYPARAAFFRTLAGAARRNLKQIRFREVEELDEKFEWPLPAPHFVRGVRAINWMIGHPWVLEGARRSTPQFHFSDYREDFFRYHAIEFESGAGVPGGYLVFSVQSGAGSTVMKLTDFNVRTDEELKTVVWIALLYAGRYRVDHFETSAELYPHLLQIPFGNFLVRRGFRHYLFHLVPGGLLERVIGDLHLQYGDGDCAFT